MGRETRIEWTDHTFNPWRGCEKVSEGCAHCYAEVLSRRNPKVLGTWGPDGDRPIAAEAYWAQPHRWNAEAQAAGERGFVFCASLADVGEERNDLIEPRLRLFKLIIETPYLVWLLLSKRSANLANWLLAPNAAGIIQGWAAYDHHRRNSHEADPAKWLLEHPLSWPLDNVWPGVSVENQARADERLPHLSALHGAGWTTFVSYEPALGDVRWEHHEDAFDWLISGGESGPDARPSHPDWHRHARDFCNQTGKAYFFKQWGEWIPGSQIGKTFSLDRQAKMLCAEVKTPAAGGLAALSYSFRAGKQLDGRLLDGRLLDGREWNERPAVEVAR